ncbi:hypothetical protein R1sor_000945 [Riccia sorocarpa]|uniref:DUF8039 domain-containing protein n=1 Tax=Riccia sorocarpa TaxID=122646 RepID=A0ABD3GUL7_9MARC
MTIPNVKDKVLLLRGESRVAFGSVHSVMATEFCHGVLVGNGRMVVQIMCSFNDNMELPFPSVGADTFSEAFGSFALWNIAEVELAEKKTKASNSTSTQPDVILVDQDQQLMLSLVPLADCCQKYRVADLKALRTEYYGMKPDRRKEIIFAKMEASQQRNDGMVLFKNGFFICRKAFWQFYGVCKSTFYNYRQQVRAGATMGFHGNKDKQKPERENFDGNDFSTSFSRVYGGTHAS